MAGKKGRVPLPVHSARGPSEGEVARLMGFYQRAAWAEGEVFARALLQRHAHFAFGWKVLGVFLERQGQKEAAEQAMVQALQRMPHDLELLDNLAILYRSLERLAEAEQCYRQMVQLDARLAAAHLGLSEVLRAQGRLAEARLSIQQAITLAPDLARAHNSLGNIHKDEDHLSLAEACYQQAVTLRPDFAEAWLNLGFVLLQQQRLPEAQSCYQQGLALRPDYPEAMRNLALVLATQGQAEAAMPWVVRALALQDNPEVHDLFVMCAQRFRSQQAAEKMQEMQEMQAAMVRALQAPWGRPAELAAAAISLLWSDAAVRTCIERVQRAWPVRAHAGLLLRAEDWAALAGNELLGSVLVSAPVCEIGLERLLTVARAEMLQGLVTGDLPALDAPLLQLLAALAQQCFINEYVFAIDDEEQALAGLLAQEVGNALTAGQPVAELALLILGMYQPLQPFPGIEHLLELSWSEPMSAVLIQQVGEPLLEVQDRHQIVSLTPIEDHTSRAVRAQYEAHPYPRWVKVEPVPTRIPIERYLQKDFPTLDVAAFGAPESPLFLVAGCGTGQHPLESARKYSNARVLAVDLSLSSLAYARRKTQELGVKNIEYAQADILALDGLVQQFDVVESVGVLHHLAQPEAGWRVLLGLLRPGGVMRLGFYSEQARQGVVNAREMIARQGYPATPEGIRRCRQIMVEAPEDYGFVTYSADFFSMSNCRDLLFHTQEHRLTLPQIDGFLRQEGLRFLGFNVTPELAWRFRQHYPEPAALQDLQCWHHFEQQHPDTFFSMYQFWVQKC